MVVTDVVELVVVVVVAVKEMELMTLAEAEAEAVVLALVEQVVPEDPVEVLHTQSSW